MLKQLTKQLCQNTDLKSTFAKNICNIICGIIEYKDVRMSQIARKFGGNVSDASNIRKIQRTLSMHLTLMIFINCILNIWFIFDEQFLLPIDIAKSSQNDA